MGAAVSLRLRGGWDPGSDSGAHLMEGARAADAGGLEEGLVRVHQRLAAQQLRGQRRQPRVLRQLAEGRMLRVEAGRAGQLPGEGAVGPHLHRGAALRGVGRRAAAVAPRRGEQRRVGVTQQLLLLRHDPLHQLRHVDHLGRLEDAWGHDEPPLPELAQHRRGRGHLCCAVPPFSPPSPPLLLTTINLLYLKISSVTTAAMAAPLRKMGGSSQQGQGGEASQGAVRQQVAQNT